MAMLGLLSCPCPNQRREHQREGQDSSLSSDEETTRQPPLPHGVTGSATRSLKNLGHLDVV